MPATQPAYVDRYFDQGCASYQYGNRRLAEIIKLSMKWNLEAEHFFNSGVYAPSGVSRVMAKPDGSLTMSFDAAVQFEQYRYQNMRGSVVGNPNVIDTLQIILDNQSIIHRIVLNGCKIIGFPEAEISGGEVKRLETEYKLMFTGGSIVAAGGLSIPLLIAPATVL
jgi:hypothetical protein